MIQFNPRENSQNYKLQNKSTGISTKNYVAFEPTAKKWVKTKLVSSQHKQHFEHYLYHSLFPSLTTTLPHTLLTAFSALEIRVSQQYSNDNSWTFTIERPFVESSLKELFQSESKFDRNSLCSALPQLLHIFLESSRQPVSVVCPATLLAKKQWGKNFQLFLNHTSLVGYHFLSKNEPILVSKFKQIYCYLHPKVIDLAKEESPLDFTCQLFSFSMNLFSLILGKEISHPLYASRTTITITLDEAAPALHNNLQQIKKLLHSNIVRQELQKAAKNLSYPKNHLIHFLEAVLGIQAKQAFTTWVEVVDYFNPGFFESYEAKTSGKVIQAMREIYQEQSEVNKEHYETVGVIRKKSLLAYSKKELIFYCLVRQSELNGAQIRTARQTYYQPGLYKLYKRLQLQALENRKKSFASVRQGNIEEETKASDEVGIDEEMQEGLNFNIYNFKESTGTTMHAFNDIQQTLNIYACSLWL